MATESLNEYLKKYGYLMDNNGELNQNQTNVNQSQIVSDKKINIYKKDVHGLKNVRVIEPHLSNIQISNELKQLNEQYISNLKKYDMDVTNYKLNSDSNTDVNTNIGSSSDVTPNNEISTPISLDKSNGNNNILNTLVDYINMIVDDKINKLKLNSKSTVDQSCQTDIYIDTSDQGIQTELMDSKPIILNNEYDNTPNLPSINSNENESVSTLHFSE